MAAVTTALGELIEHHRDEILAEWTSEARRAAAARGLTEPEMANAMPHLLDTIASPQAHDELPASVESHIGQRIHLGYELAEIVREFALLETSICAVSDRLPEEARLPLAEKERLGGAVRSAIVQVTELFQDHMDRDAQRNRRYLHHLQQVADATLRQPDTALGARLEQILDIIREAMGGQSAALLLYDPDTERLVTHAASGRAKDALSELSTTLALSEFTGRVASRDLPTSFDTRSGELRLTPELRDAGIEVLLGVRLPPAASLVGIIFVGLSERREFQPGERMRLETFGRWLTLQLDNATLLNQLHEANESLRSERDLRERFVAMLAHDLRGFLAVSRIGVQLVLRDAQVEEGHRTTLRRADQNLGLAERMLRNLLDVYRARAGAPLPLRIERCDLTEVAETTVHDLRPGAWPPLRPRRRRPHRRLLEQGRGGQIDLEPLGERGEVRGSQRADHRSFTATCRSRGHLGSQRWRSDPARASRGARRLGPEPGRRDAGGG